MSKINLLTVKAHDLKELPYSTNEIIGDSYSNIILVPCGIHQYSGFGTMKLILLGQQFWDPEALFTYDLIGVVGGYCDLLLAYRETRIAVDMLPCGFNRIILSKPAKVPNFIGSDFFIERDESNESLERKDKTESSM